MKIIDKSFYASWENDPDKGEFLIGQGLIKNKHFLSDYSYVYIALSPLINEKGIFQTQKIIDDIVRENINTKLIFVCQHIFINQIKWGYNSTVFSTHATKHDDIIFIPHYSATYNISKIKEEKDLLFSFVGHCGTHEIREALIKKYPDKCFSTEGIWMSTKYRDKYIDLLGRSKFSICPRGTGVSSLRIFESLKMGSIPVVISDDLHLPITHSWDEFSVRINENEIDKIEEILLQYSDERIKNMSLLGQEYWNSCCSDENLYKTIIETLKNKDE